ncbi:lipase 3 [Plutella xylostella]|uniref:lipase 3 n=1 Tax=Plutella xylostella TaxID=51655 RepID=UPI002032B9CF|nr:lipase 3 [Plutella xylostella]
MMLLWVLACSLAALQGCQAQGATSTAGNLVNYTALFGTSPRKDLDFLQLCRYDGYDCEAHTVTTLDGYILSVFRVLPNANCTEQKQPILFMHGLYLTGDDCLTPGPGAAHCYLYSDACHEVWVPNVRGNRYSRRHVYLNPDRDDKFWDFALEEHSYLDLPASVDYVLAKTGQPKVAFVGHAQGATMLVLLCAKYPAYNDKISVGFGISMTAWLNHATFPVLTIQGVLAPLLTGAVNLGVNGELFPHGGITTTAAEALCGLNTASYPFCSVLLFATLGYNRFQITNETLPVVVGHIPGGTSLKNFNRWGQIRKNGFTEYDYGFVRNWVKYGWYRPPQFDLSRVSVPLVFLGSEGDVVAAVPDVIRLRRALTTAELCVLADKTFGHLDFVYGKDVPNYITPKILSSIENGTYVCDGYFI